MGQMSNFVSFRFPAVQTDIEGQNRDCHRSKHRLSANRYLEQSADYSYLQVTELLKGN